MAHPCLLHDGAPVCRVSVGPVLSELLDGLLEPVVEDRMSAAEALDTIRGQARSLPGCWGAWVLAGAVECWLGWRPAHAAAGAFLQAKRRARKAASAASSAAAQPQKIIMLPDGTTYSMPAQLPRKLKKPAGSRVQVCAWSPAAVRAAATGQPQLLRLPGGCLSNE